MDHADFASAARIAAVIHAHRGASNRSAELLQLMVPESLGDAAAEGAIALIGIGDLATAERMLAGSRAGAPTATSTGWQLATTGLLHSVRGDGVAGLAPLLQAVSALAPVGRDRIMLDSPAALAALMALHLGELDLAESVLQRAVAADLGGPVLRPRHQILRAWVAMARGDLAEATATLESVGELPVDDARDFYVMHAVRVGIARRASDAGALADVWAKARTAVFGMSVDLFNLLPLGELLVGAARMQDEHWLAPQLQQADVVLGGVGRPALWSAAFHWYGVQAAIASDRPDTLIPHADAISEAAQVSRHAQTLMAAGHTWVRVLARNIDPAAINRAVEGLSAIGLRWDASRLAAQAALHSTDRRVSLDLLNLARAAHGGHGATSTSASTRSRTSQLTDREWEIARLVVQGIGYREIGERLFISPRTVEHHVASVRRRLGSTNRAEMIGTLRRLLAASSPGDDQVGVASSPTGTELA
jgi:DNA-binding CsgD family transcriptional regulator